MQKLLPLIALAATVVLSTAQAQNDSTEIWSTLDASRQSSEAERTVSPTRSRALLLDLPGMVETLARVSSQGPGGELTLSLPHPDGGFTRFRMRPSGLMSPGLAKRYPEIRTYRGQAVDESGAQVWLDVTPRGFHAMVRDAEGSWFIDPYFRGQTDAYVSYWRADLPRPVELPNLQDPIDDEGVERDSHLHSQGDSELQARGDELRTYRLAMAATGEYTQFHGGTVAAGLAAIVTTMNRVAGVYEDELSVSFELIDNTDEVIYTNGATDPYTNNSGSAMLGQNQANLDSVIGSGEYDIGHVFSTGGGGIARLRSVCGAGIKARGVTGLGSPVGDPFDVDYVAHEIGHQFGGNHTFNNCSGSAGPIPYEPFSGSTIMAYAGICGTNLQNNSDAHFHTGNFDEISDFLQNGGGECGSLTQLNNDAPTVDAGTGGFTIPADTPFILTGSATDPDGDTLRYRWEQHDLSSNNGPPLFRSFSATPEPTRIFPRLSDLLNNTTDVGEALPTGSRTMSFRLTALDDNANGGGVDYDEIVFDVDGGSGPFLVTAPNTAVTWTGGQSETVSWDVAGTDQAPVSCPSVDIDLSTDGGQTFDVNVASATSNDGIESVTVPNVATSQARLRVRCSNNIFFDISNTNFTIEAGASDFSLAVSPSTLEACVGDTAIADIAVGQIDGFSEVVNLSASGHGGSTSFSQNDQVPPFDSQLQLGGLSEGSFTVTVTGTASSGTKQDTLDLTVLDAPSTGPGLTSPADGADVDGAALQLEWASVAGVSSYRVEIDDQASFSSPLLSQVVTGTSLAVPSDLLESDTPYFWRVSSENGCGLQASVVRQFTTTPAPACQVYASSDVPLTVGPDPSTTTSNLVIADAGNIVDVDVVDLTITHSWIQDMIITLTSPSNTDVVLIEETCGLQNDVFMSLDDESDEAANSWPCPPVDGLSYQPENPLSAFDGEASDGTWVLSVEDTVVDDGGSLDAWSLRVCREVASSRIFRDRFEGLAPP